MKLTIPTILAVVIGLSSAVLHAGQVAAAPNCNHRFLFVSLPVSPDAAQTQSGANLSNCVEPHRLAEAESQNHSVSVG